MSPTDPDEAIARVGRRIAELREDRGWTQQEFADRIAASLKYVQRVEGGRDNLTIHTLVKFANALQADLADLFANPSRDRRGRAPP